MRVLYVLVNEFTVKCYWKSVCQLAYEPCLIYNIHRSMIISSHFLYFFRFFLSTKRSYTKHIIVMLQSFLWLQNSISHAFSGTNGEKTYILSLNILDSLVIFIDLWKKVSHKFIWRSGGDDLWTSGLWARHPSQAHNRQLGSEQSMRGRDIL